METLFSRLGAFCATTAVYPQDDWSLVASTTVTGLVVVFLILTALVLILMLMGWVLKSKGKKNETVVEARVPLVQPEVAVEDDDDFMMVSDDAEVIAAITAAITAFGAENGKTYAIKRIQKKETSGISSWRAAGIQNNTQKF